MLTAEQRAAFSALGVVKLRAFSAAEAGRMQDAVWAELLRVHGIRRDDPSSWRAGDVYGLARIAEVPTFLPIAGCRGAIDDLLGSGSWDVPKRWGAFLVTFPSDGEWDVPSTLWHADFSYALPLEPLSGVKVFTFLSDVPARTGGTLVVAGSHRVVQQFVKGRSPQTLRDTRRNRLQLLGSHEWLRDLTSRSSSKERVRRFIERGSTIDGIAVRVIELTGEAGEVVLTHPWVLHCRAANCGKAPRFMRSVDIYRRELQPMVFRRAERQLLNTPCGSRAARTVPGRPHL
jgi:hypothetical protein